MSTLQPFAALVLTAIACNEPVYIGELNALPDLKTSELMPAVGCRNTVYDLVRQQMLAADERAAKGQSGAAYSITRKGRLALSRRDSTPARGKKPTPRQPAEDTKPYDGHDLRPFIGRPGALHAFTLPSMVNGERIERARPTIMGIATNKSVFK